MWSPQQPAHGRGWGITRASPKFAWPGVEHHPGFTHKLDGTGVGLTPGYFTRSHGVPTRWGPGVFTLPGGVYNYPILNYHIILFPVFCSHVFKAYVCSTCPNVNIGYLKNTY